MLYMLSSWYLIHYIHSLPWMLLNVMDVHYIPAYPLLGKFFQLFLFTVRSHDTLDDAKMLSSSSSRVAKLVRTSGTMAGTPHRLKPLVFVSGFLLWNVGQSFAVARLKNQRSSPGPVELPLCHSRNRRPPANMMISTSGWWFQSLWKILVSWDD